MSDPALCTLATDAVALLERIDAAAAAHAERLARAELANAAIHLDQAVHALARAAGIDPAAIVGFVDFAALEARILGPVQ